MLLGREAETTRLSGLIHAARDGRSNVLVIRGEPGIGKSALLGHVQDQFADSLVLATRATEVESEIPYVHLADLLRPIAGEITEVGSRQADALNGVLARAPAVAGDRFAVAAATLSLVGVLARRGPLLVLVDDVQWVDAYSFDVVTFVGRRLRAEGALVLITQRIGTTTPPGLHRFEHVVLGGLDDATARRLVESTGHRLSRPNMDRLLADARGNPLALTELAAVLSASGVAPSVRDLDPLPISDVVEDAFRQNLSVLPDDCRDALLLLATLGTAATEVVRTALDLAGLSVGNLSAAEDARLLVEQDGRLVFRHPLIRSAVHQSAPAAQRRRAHLYAAEALADSTTPNALERRAWHLVASGGGPDETLAAPLEAAAQEEYERANFAVAANLFARSGQVGAPGPKIAERLLRAADATRLAGGIDEARNLLVRSLETVTDRGLSIVIRYYVCRIDVWRGTRPQAAAELLELAREAEPVDPNLAAHILVDAALANAEAGRLADSRELIARAATVSRSNDEPLEFDIVRALVHGLGGDEATSRRALSRRADEVDALDPLAPDLADQLLLVAAIAHLTLEDVDRAEALLSRGVVGARRAGAAGVLPFRLGRLAYVHHWHGRWTSAMALATEAMQLADDTGWVTERPNSLALLAQLEAATGQSEQCREHARLAAAAAPAALYDVLTAQAHAALGRLALGAGDHADAAQHYTLVDDFASANGLRDTPMLWWSGDLIESCVLAGRMAEARTRLTELDSTLAERTLPTLAAVAARCRALVEPAEFDRHIAEALDWHDRASMPFERARTELTLGAHLRRRDPEAREHLDVALAIFGRLGAAPWLDRTRAELEGVGERIRPRPPLAALTPQELQVALQVAQGLTNREVAASLFLSVKTVEFHLGNVFHKLGVKRRTQLAMIIAQQEPAHRR